MKLNAIATCDVIDGCVLARTNMGLTPAGKFLVTLGDRGTSLTTHDATGPTAPFSQPLPIGMTNHSATVSFDLGPVMLRDITDVVSLTIL